MRETHVKSLDGSGKAIPAAAIQALGNSMAGNCLLPGDAGYEEARTI
jgi:hypothetical protein